MTETPRSQQLLRFTRGYGLGCILLGVALWAISQHFDGLFGGFFSGAAIALALLGVWLVSGRAGRRMSRDLDAHGWLPSKDGDRR